MHFPECLKFHNPFRKTLCSSCYNQYDCIEKQCPACKADSNEDPAFRKSFERTVNLDPWRELILALTGWCGFQILGIIIQIIVVGFKTAELSAQGLTGDELQTAIEAFTKTGSALALFNYPVYGLLITILLLIIWKGIVKFFPAFKWKETYIYGALMAIALLAISVLWNMVASALGATTNENQSAVIEMVKTAPVFAVLITGIIGPLCEEITYRVGFFGFGKRINRIFAYFLASVVFGLIHIHDWVSLNEWLSFPSYLFSGLLLAFTYEKFGLGASWIAHSVNNLVGVIQILLMPSESA